MANKTKSVVTTDLKHSTEEKVKYEDRVVRKIIADALMGVDGFLGTTGGFLGGKIKSPDEEAEIMKGISYSVGRDGEVEVRIPAIVETGKNIPAIIDGVTQGIIAALRDSLDLQAKTVKVDVVKTMSAQEYEAQYIKGAKKAD